MKVRLINPLLAEIARLDTVETQAAAGYDPDFQEVRPVIVDGQRQLARKDKDPIRIRCQIEDDTMAQLQATNAGNAYGQKLAIIIDYTDLARQGLLDAITGEPLFNVGDKLLAFYDSKCGRLLQTIRSGLWATEVRPINWGLAQRVNLLRIQFNDRHIVGHDRP